MARRTKAYVDTSALIAFVDRSDTHHALFARLFSDPPDLVTCSLVIAEGHGWFLKRFDRTRALQFLSLASSLSPMQVLSVGEPELGAAHRVLAEFQDQDLTLADAVGLHVMKVHRVRSCWSTDRHLGLSGVPLVIHEH